MNNKKLLAILINIFMIVSCYKGTYGDHPVTEKSLLIDSSGIFIFTYNLLTWLFELYNKKWLYTAITLNIIVIAGLFLEMLLTPSEVLRTSSTSILFGFLLLSSIPYYNISLFRGMITKGDASDKKSYYISIAALLLIIILMAYTLFNIETVRRDFTLYSYLIIISLSWILNKLVTWQHKTKI